MCCFASKTSVLLLSSVHVCDHKSHMDRLLYILVHQDLFGCVLRGSLLFYALSVGHVRVQIHQGNGEQVSDNVRHDHKKASQESHVRILQNDALFYICNQHVLWYVDRNQINKVQGHWQKCQACYRKEKWDNDMNSYRL